MIWNKGVEGIAGEHWKGNIYSGHKKCADHISNEEAHLRFVIREENLKRMFCVVHRGVYHK